MNNGLAASSTLPTTGRPAATIRITAAQALIRYLQVQWSERDGLRQRAIPAIFGIFGHGNVCGIGEAIDECGAELPFFQPKNEQAMVHTAIGFAKAHNRLATLACSASVGPGSTNLVTGAATATVNRIPVLLLAADTFASRLQGPVMQALESGGQGDLTVNDSLRPVSAFFDRISRPEQLLTALPEAMRILLDPAEAGAVTLSIFQDTQGEVYDYPVTFFEPRVWHVVRRPPAREELGRAAAVIREAKQPLIVAGGGVHYSDAAAELLAWAQTCGIPVAETSAGKGAMPEDHGLAVGGLGVTGTRAANALARDADVVVCVGTRLIDLTTGSHSIFEDAGVRFVGINVTGSDAHKVGAVPIVADAKLAVRALAEELETWSSSLEWRARVRMEREQWDEALAADLRPREGETLSQGQVLRALNEFTGPEDVLVVASGTPHVEVHKLWQPIGHARVLMEVGFSCMGHEIPAAVGVRLARGGNGQVYAFIGDGTYLMGPTELATAAQERLKITVVVSVNHGYQSIHRLQRNTTGSSFGLEFRRDRLNGPFIAIDYAANARSLGCTVFEADTLDAFTDALGAAEAAAGPCVIVTHVEPRREVLASQCWWDVGITASSERDYMQAIAAEHLSTRTELQRFYG